MTKRTTLTWIGCLGLCIIAGAALAEDPPQANDSKDTKAVTLPVVTTDVKLLTKGKAAFLNVAYVLKSPRCQNCHPAGDKPLQTDLSVPHAMNISRKSVKNGLQCSTCHREQNTDLLKNGGKGGPPGAPHWGLPPEKTPMVFQNTSPHNICKQMRDPAQNGKKTLAQLVEHVRKDPLVLWGWSPGGKRTTPPLTHVTFVSNFKIWAQAGAPCPDAKLTVKDASEFKKVKKPNAKP